jgi:hypothetical protein
VYIEEARLIGPGTKEMCRATVNSRHHDSKSNRYINRHVEVKLDPCRSVSIGNYSLLTNIKSCKGCNVPTVTLKGIGCKSEPLTKAGILKHVLENNHVVKWLCYVFHTPVGHSKKLLLLGMSAIKLSAIDINYHIDESFEGRPSALQFKQGFKNSKVIRGRIECYEYLVEKENVSPCDIYRNSDIYRNTTLYDEQDNKVLITEIQLKNIVDRLGKERGCHWN